MISMNQALPTAGGIKAERYENHIRQSDVTQKPENTQSSGRTDPDRVSLGSTVQTRWDNPEDVARNFNADTVVKNISGPILQAIERARSAGASEEELAQMRSDAEAGIGAGMDQAQDVIKGLGLMSEELTDKLASAESRIMDLLQGERGVSPEEAPAAASGVSERLASGSGNDFVFQVRTREGDLIEITANSRRSGGSETSANGADAGSRMSAVWFDSSEQAFSLSVQGDLNDSERQALDSLMQDVEDISRQFFNGDYEDAYAKAQELEIGDEALASMSLNLTQRSFRVAEYESVQQGTDATERAAADKAASDWLAPIRQYARELVSAQRRSADDLTPQTFMEALQAHPRQSSSLIDFARSVMDRLG